MYLQVVGCSHHETALELREKLTLGTAETCEALRAWRQRFPQVEAVLLCTCNRVELYTAAAEPGAPTPAEAAEFLAGRRALEAAEILPHLYRHAEEAAVRHLFTVACSLDSMVVGESQILAQVKESYQLAAQQESAGPLLHATFQAALRAARRVAGETALHLRRVSVSSVAIGGFARQIFERFDDKHVVLIGAGETAEETLRYLRDEGAHQISIINRNFPRAGELAARWQGKAVSWEQLGEALATADLVVSATASTEPIVTPEQFGRIERARFGRPLFILDLAVPRDFSPLIGRRPNIYLYCLDDLQEACRRNQADRCRELPAAQEIIEQETARFLGDLHHRAAGPIIAQLKQGWQRPKEEELQRLLHKLPHLSERDREEIRRAFDRLTNKLLHPPLESLRDESHRGASRVLMDALARLFQLKD
ncbi:MAG: glutamyl-tRNA reductase [Pirellulales bacterium]|nr:glutamyl-tRNA reductase [Pirellulales bacterium]